MGALRLASYSIERKSKQSAYRACECQRHSHVSASESCLHQSPICSHLTTNSIAWKKHVEFNIILKCHLFLSFLWSTRRCDAKIPNGTSLFSGGSNGSLIIQNYSIRWGISYFDEQFSFLLLLSSIINLPAF